MERKHITLRTQSSGGKTCSSRQAQELLTRNNPKHMAKTTQVLNQKKVNVLEWLSQNTHLSPIEHLQNYLKLKFTVSIQFDVA